MISLRVKHLISSIGISALSLGLAGVALAADGNTAAIAVDAQVAKTDQLTTIISSGDAQVSVVSSSTQSSDPQAATPTLVDATQKTLAAIPVTNGTSAAEPITTEIIPTPTAVQTIIASEPAHALRALKATAIFNASYAQVLSQTEAASSYTSPISAPQAPASSHAPEPINLPNGANMLLNQLGSVGSLLAHSQIASSKFPVSALALLITALVALLVAAQRFRQVASSGYTTFLRRSGFAHAARGVTLSFATLPEVSLMVGGDATSSSLFDRINGLGLGLRSTLVGHLGLVGGER